MDKQVDKKHYEFSKYSYPDRWVSYFYQLKKVLESDPKSILEIGVGDKVFGSFIKNNTNIHYQSLDVASDLNPDIVGSVSSIPCEKESFDTVCAFEVLEHLPFDKLTLSLDEMLRVSRGKVVISIPHFGPPIKFSLKIPFLPEVKLSFKIPFYKKHEFNGEHYWEVGKRGYSLNKVISEIEKRGKIVEHFVPFENQYHHFFVIDKK